MSAVVKHERQRAIRELVARTPIGSQDELVLALARRGFAVTQATVSRDIADLGLVKVTRGDRHVYIAPEDLAPGTAAAVGTAANGEGRVATADERLRRILAEVPVQVRRSGLILLLVGTPGTASVIAQAIDDSSLDEQEGTLAGDDTLLVLFASEARLERWLERFDALVVGVPARQQASRSSASSPGSAAAAAPVAAPSASVVSPSAPVVSPSAPVVSPSAPIASHSASDPSSASADSAALSATTLVSEASR